MKNFEKIKELIVEYVIDDVNKERIIELLSEDKKEFDELNNNIKRLAEDTEKALALTNSYSSVLIDICKHW